jgi:ubiquitin conjugation factor E4 B
MLSSHEQPDSHEHANSEVRRRQRISEGLKLMEEELGRSKNAQRFLRCSVIVDEQSPRFVQLVNILLTDVTYLLDEGLSKLMDINKLQTYLEYPPASTNPPDPYRCEQEQLLATRERQATSCIPLANEAVSLLNKFTAFAPDAFVHPEVVDRLAQMLNFNQVILTGYKCRYLKVKDPSKYHFKPKELLCMIVDIYLNLRKEGDFILACARDGRNSRREVFMKTIAILKKYSLMGINEINAFEKFVDDVEIIKQQSERTEEYIENIPE